MWKNKSGGNEDDILTQNAVCDIVYGTFITYW